MVLRMMVVGMYSSISPLPKEPFRVDLIKVFVMLKIEVVCEREWRKIGGWSNDYVQCPQNVINV